MLFKSDTDIKSALRGVINVNGNDVEVADADRLRDETIDRLVYNALFYPAEDVRYYLSWLIREAAAKLVIYPASMVSLYERLGRRTGVNFTIPAFSLDVLTYDSARACFRGAKASSTGAFAFQMGDGHCINSPLEYATGILGAAIKEHYQGPVFLQANHLRLNEAHYRYSRDDETDRLKNLAEEAVSDGFLNADIDTTPAIDLTQAAYYEQERDSYAECAEIAAHIRHSSPPEVTVALGAHLVEVDERRQTAEYFRTFMEGFTYELADRWDKAPGLSKIVVEPNASPIVASSPEITESSLGGLEDISEIARRDYGMMTALRAGQWAIPDELIEQLRAHDIGEVHLGDRYESFVLDHSHFSDTLRADLRRQVEAELGDQRRPGENDAHFYHRMRKSALAAFKQPLWDATRNRVDGIMADLEHHLVEDMGRLGAVKTEALVRDTVDIQEVKLPTPTTGYAQNAEATLNGIIDRLSPYPKGLGHP